MNSNWRYLKKLFGRKMDSLYDKILCKDIFNEYDKHFEIIRILSGRKINKIVSKATKLQPKITTNQKVLNFISNGDFIIIAPCASYSVKEYGLKNYKILCNELSRDNKIILIGAEKESRKLDYVADSNKDILNASRIVNLSETIYLITISKLFIGNDSGFSHIALKYNVPMISIVGGGFFNKYFPYMESKHRIYLYNKLDCFGCEWNCIYPERYCITEVKVERVLEEANRIAAKIAAKQFW